MATAETELSRKRGPIFRLERFLSMSKANLMYYFVIVGTTQAIYSVVCLREVLYEPFRAELNVTNTQFGTLMGIVGIVQIFGYLAFGWLQDRINIRYLLTIDLLGYGLSALTMSVIPGLPYPILLMIFCLFGVFGDAIYWPTIQKCIKGISHPDKQATAFGFMETWRGVSGVIINGVAIIIYAVLGSTIFGMQAAMTLNSILMILFAFVVFKFIPNDFLQEFKRETTKRKSSTLSKDKEHIISSLKNPVVWLTGLSASCVYAVFAGVTTYFVPFLQNIYALPVAMVGVFGIINGQGTRVISSVLSGTISDRKFKTSASWMAICYGVTAALFLAILIIPRDSTYLVIMIPMMLIASVLCYFVRAIYYAPIGEARIPNESSATAMSIASFIGYSPNFWAFTLFGYLLDRYAGNQAYQYIFLILLGFSVVGVLSNIINHHFILRERRLHS